MVVNVSEQWARCHRKHHTTFDTREPPLQISVRARCRMPTRLAAEANAFGKRWLGGRLWLPTISDRTNGVRSNDGSIIARQMFSCALQAFSSIES
jgi:hypothetical protein